MRNGRRRWRRSAASRCRRTRGACGRGWRSRRSPTETVGATLVVARRPPPTVIPAKAGIQRPRAKGCRRDHSRAAPSARSLPSAPCAQAPRLVRWPHGHPRTLLANGKTIGDGPVTAAPPRIASCGPMQHNPFSLRMAPAAHYQTMQLNCGPATTACAFRSKNNSASPKLGSARSHRNCFSIFAKLRAGTQLNCRLRASPSLTGSIAAEGNELTAPPVSGTIAVGAIETRGGKA